MPDIDTAPKEMLFIFRERSMHILVPKRRGEGFLRTPIGHHQTPLSDLAYKIGFDMFGLDGDICVDTGYVAAAQRPEMIERVLKPISELLGFPYRECSIAEYDDNHPVKSNTTTPLLR